MTCCVNYSAVFLSVTLMLLGNAAGRACGAMAANTSTTRRLCLSAYRTHLELQEHGRTPRRQTGSRLRDLNPVRTSHRKASCLVSFLLLLRQATTVVLLSLKIVRPGC